MAGTYLKTHQNPVMVTYSKTHRNPVMGGNAYIWTEHYI